MYIYNYVFSTKNICRSKKIGIFPKKKVPRCKYIIISQKVLFVVSWHTFLKNMSLPTEMVKNVKIYIPQTLVHLTPEG